MIEREQLIAMVRAAQNGEEGAAGVLYQTFYKDIQYFIMGKVNDAELAKDLTQDTFIEIFDTIDALREPAAFVTWSRQIAYHRCTAYNRKRRELLFDRVGTVMLDTVAEERREFIPDEALDIEELKETIREMIDALPEEQRSAILMRYFEEIPVKDIAEIQGVAEGTVKSRLTYGKKRIKKSVEAYEKQHGIKLHCKGVIPLLLWLFLEYQDVAD